MLQPIACFLIAIVFSNSSSLAQFGGNAFFSTAPTSQLGPVTNNLIITNTPTGFSVSGQVIIATPAAPPTDSGTLVSWVIDRALSPSFVFGSWTTTTSLVGFSAPPPGAVGTTAGSATTSFTEPTMQTPSTSTLALSLVSGAATWNLTNTSSTFSGATPAAPTYYLRQTFFLDGIYQAGAGGNWVVDVPLDSTIAQVPEPRSLLGVLPFAILLLGARARSPHSSSCRSSPAVG